MKSIENFIKGLTILSQYFPEGMQKEYFCQAEHDQLYFFVYEDAEITKADCEKLAEYGFHVDEYDGWSYFT